MRKLVTALVLVMMISCVDDKEIFIPNELSGPASYIKELVPSQSLYRDLDPQRPQQVLTDYNTRLILSENMVEVNPGEDYSLSFIELSNYRDYVLHNVEHSSDQGAIHVIYSFYIAIEKDHEVQPFREGAYIDVRIPHEEIMEPLLVGKGDFESGRLNWFYNNNSLNKGLQYVEWLESDGNENDRTESGYQVRVNSPGWYSLVIRKENNYNFHNICLQFDPLFNRENTLVYLLSDSNLYVSQVILNEQGFSCSEDLPFLNDETYKLVSISEIDNQLYFYKGTVDKTSGSISVNPQIINAADLKLELNSL